MENKKEINYQVLQAQAEFYNKNQKVFKEIKNEFGIDLWFLVHFRIYFDSRNKLYNKTILNSHARSNIISSLISFAKLIAFSFRLNQTKTNNSSLCVISSASKKEDKMVGRLRENGFNLYAINVPKMGQKTNLNKDILGSENNYGNTNTFYLLLKGCFSFSNIIKLSSLNHKLKKASKKFVVETEKDKLFFDRFYQLKKSLLLNYFEYLAYKKYFNKNTFKALVTYDENSPSKRVIWEAAKANGIKVFALQHGAIHDLHPAYNYTHYTIKPELPNYTYVWGEYYKNLLIIYGYTHYSLLLSGPLNKDYFDKKNTLKEAKIWLEKNNPKRKKIICFATQPQRDFELRKKQLLDVLKVINANDNFLLILRPHPAEEVEYFYDVIKKHNFPNSKVIVDKTSNLELHFEVSDALITSFSTVGVEYISHYKPLFVLDYLNQDIQGYIKNNVGISIQNQSDLKELLSNFDNITINKEYYDNFINDYYDNKIENKTEFVLSKIQELT